jgi:hypothetical protein
MLLELRIGNIFLIINGCPTAWLVQPIHIKLSAKLFVIIVEVVL